MFSSIVVFFMILAAQSQNSHPRLEAMPLSFQSLALKEPARLSTQTDVGSPARLKIPRINVDSALEYVGLTEEGNVGVPEGPANAAWFNRGPRPGEKGSAVIVGHYGWKEGKAAVFDSLHTLRTGDILYIEDEKGATLTFVVREVRTYEENEDASYVFGAGDGKAHLNLITCQGRWDKAKKSYPERLVVFTDKVDSIPATDGRQARSLQSL